MSKRAIILAGGMGTRLRPFTIAIPKPLVPVGQYPILEIIVRQLAHFRFEHLTLAVNHQADIIRAYFGDGSKWGLKIDYSLEDRPLGTMGPLKLINDLPENFLIMNGDILTDLDYAQFYRDHSESGHLFTISSCKRLQTSEYGVLEVNESGRLAGFKEKPVTEYLVSMGIYMANRKILEFIPGSVAYGFDHLMTELIKQQQPSHVQVFNGYWLDIGRADDYARAIEEFETTKHRFLR